MNKKQARRLGAIRGLKPLPKAERHRYTVKDVAVGGYLSIGEEVFKVLSIGKYLDAKWNFRPKKQQYWTYELELLSLKTGEVLFLEWYEDDEIELWLTEQEVGLRELRSDYGKVSRELLEYFAEEEEGEIQWRGKTFCYDDEETYAALYFRDAFGSDTEGVPVRFFAFEADDGTTLTIEMWYDDASDSRPEREAFTSRTVRSSEVEVLQLKEESNA